MGDFEASNGWLEHFKKRFGLRQTRIVGEEWNVPITTIKAWMERLPENIQGYSADDIWNMDESGLLFKALPDAGLAKKIKKFKSGKKSKERLTVAFSGLLSSTVTYSPLVDSRYVKLLLLESVKFRNAFENCLVLLNRMVCSIFTAKNHG